MPNRPRGRSENGAEAVFLTEARELVSLVEGSAGFPEEARGADAERLLIRLQSILCRLHWAFLHLPEAREVAHCPPSESHLADSSSVYEAWKTLGPRLADALAGVYRDLIDGLELYRRGTEDDRQAALWAWQSLYWQHWGDELLKAQAAAYRRLARERFDRELS